MTPDVSVVIVSYNTKELLRACLVAVLAQQGVVLEVIVVDNASTDGSTIMVGDEFDESVVLEALEENIGFARACNRATRRAQGEWILLLNPDTEAQPGAVAALVAAARRAPRAGLIGARTITATGATDPKSCWGIATLWSTFCFASGLSHALARSRLFDPASLGRWERDSEREVGIVSGSVLLAPRRVWEELGGFDEQFFMYAEDADLSIRARQAGYRPRITPDAVVMHVVGASSSEPADKLLLLLRGKATLMRKHWSPPRREAGLLLLRVGAAMRAVGGSEAWRAAWRQRRDWAVGWPPLPAEAPRSTR